MTTDQQPIIDKNFAGMTNSLFSAVWLTMLVVFVMLLDWRTSMIIGVSIPLSFLTTFAYLLFSGYTLNMVTLFGLIIAVGMVVDASIVVVENVYRRLQSGEVSGQAISGGTREVLFSIFGGMLTTVVGKSGSLGLSSNGRWRMAVAIMASATVAGTTPSVIDAAETG